MEVYMKKKHDTCHNQWYSFKDRRDYERDCDENEDPEEDYFDVNKHEIKEKRKWNSSRRYDKENPY